MSTPRKLGCLLVPSSLAAGLGDCRVGDMPLYSVIIPNWCGGETLRRGVTALIAEGRRELRRDSAWEFEVVVVDDASHLTKGGREEWPTFTAAFNPAEFPELKSEVRTSNGGFGATINRAAEIATGQVLVLCNNDLLPQRGFLRSLIEPLLDKKSGVGATSARTEDEAGTPNHAAIRGRWSNGQNGRGGRMTLYWREAPLPETKEFEPIEAHFFQGGAAAVRSDLWRELGGMDDLFSPAYWEDYDMSHRLRALGHRILYVPAARAFHVGKASMTKRHGGKRVADLRARNRLLFEWRHTPDRAATRAAIAQAVGDEWRNGGPFHTTRGLLKARKKMRSLRSSITTDSTNLYPPDEIANFLAVPLGDY